MPPNQLIPKLNGRIQYRINVDQYITDNSIFTKTKFTQEINESNQIISSCEVRVHHQNSHVERVIRTVVTTSKPLMLHVILQCSAKTNPHPTIKP